MSEIQTTSKKNKKGFTKKSTKVDLTPMVDLGFLLITFFVFTSTMSMATAMQMNEPKDGKPIVVPASGAMTILLGKENKISYYFGEPATLQCTTTFTQTNFKDIRDEITKKKQTTPLQKLMYIIKSTDSSTFGNAMKIVDEMTICNIPAGHYVEDRISEVEENLID